MRLLRHQKGYTLLFAIIVSTIVLSVAAFILSISRKQFILSSAARDSTVSIYAADSGIQCALKAYPYNSASGFSANCNGASFSSGPFTSVSTNLPNVGFNTSTVTKSADVIVAIGSPAKSCAIVTIYSGNDTQSPTPGHITVISSRGYNNYSGSTCPQAGPRDEERAIQLVYHD